MLEAGRRATKLGERNEGRVAVKEMVPNVIYLRAGSPVCVCGSASVEDTNNEHKCRSQWRENIHLVVKIF